MQFTVEALRDYNRRLNFKKSKLKCYSKKQLKKRYPDKGYTIIGETKRFADESDSNGIIASYGERAQLSVSNYKDNSRILYREAGYLSVEENRYIAVLKSRIPFLLILLTFLLLLGVALYLIFKGPASPAGYKVDPLPEKDPFVQTVPDNGESDTGSQSGNKVSMSYVLKAKTSLSTAEVGIYFSNPHKSNQDVVLELYVENGEEDILLAASGLIPRGSSLVRMTAEQNGLSRLKVGNYKGYYRVICYSSETGEKALVEPRITDVEITVIK